MILRAEATRVKREAIRTGTVFNCHGDKEDRIEKAFD